jgi:hypothetical protein
MSRSYPDVPPAEGPGDGSRRIGDVWQRLGLSGLFFGTDGNARRTFRAAYIATAVIVGVINTLNVISQEHDLSRVNPLEPVIWEASSWATVMAFFWIIWLAWRAAPLNVRPRWLLLIHVPAALIYSLAHVGGFIALRILAYRVLGGHYHAGPFWPTFSYELRKDGLGYLLWLAAFALIERLVRQQRPAAPAAPAADSTFDIRDGAKLTRVRLSEILAVTSAGNYVEFALEDGRRLLMRKALAALENDLENRGFVRTHRSWLVNAARVTGLKPEGSGDYEISLGSLEVPLSRRFKAALTKLRAG